MELVSTIWIDPMAIMQIYPEEEGRLSVGIRPFQLTVWSFFTIRNFENKIFYDRYINFLRFGLDSYFQQLSSYSLPLSLSS